MTRRVGNEICETYDTVKEARKTFREPLVWQHGRAACALDKLDIKIFIHMPNPMMLGRVDSVNTDQPDPVYQPS